MVCEQPFPARAFNDACYDYGSMVGYVDAYLLMASFRTGMVDNMRAITPSSL
jgi:hypothetical protein